MNVDELIRAYASNQGAVAFTIALALGLWAARRVGLVKELTPS